MSRETVAEIILRTCERYDKIKHLPPDRKKYLMSLSEEDFKKLFWEQKK
ncbi:MAG: hypothetical protein AAFX46_12840 [Cyanobacteria bacterium J06636_27]